MRDSAYRVVAGICSDRRYFALALDIPADRVLFRLADALAAPQPPPALPGGPCQEVVDPAVDLTSLPFLTHWPQDGGAYASAAVVFINDPDTGPNASYHRLLRLDRTRLAARLVERRGTETAWRKVALGATGRRTCQVCPWQSASVCRRTFCWRPRWRRHRESTS